MFQGGLNYQNNKDYYQKIGPRYSLDIIHNTQYKTLNWKEKEKKKSMYHFIKQFAKCLHKTSVKLMIYQLILGMIFEKRNDKTKNFHKFYKCDHFVPHANCKRKIILSLLLQSNITFLQKYYSFHLFFLPLVGNQFFYLLILKPMRCPCTFRGLLFLLYIHYSQYVLIRVILRF